MRKIFFLFLLLAPLASCSIYSPTFNLDYDFASSNLSIQVPPNSDSYSNPYLDFHNNWGSWHTDFAFAGGTIFYDSYVGNPGSYSTDDYLAYYTAFFDVPGNSDPDSYSLGVANLSMRFSIDQPASYEIILNCTGELSHGQYHLTNTATNTVIARTDIDSCDADPLIDIGLLEPGSYSFFSFSNARAGTTFAESSIRLTAVRLPHTSKQNKIHKNSL